MKFPFSRLQVHGSSMLPTFSPGQFLVSFDWAYFFVQPKKGEVVVIKKSGRLMIKRIQKTRGHEFFVAGDNPKGSTDSRQFGWLNKNQIVGKVIYILKLADRTIP